MYRYLQKCLYRGLCPKLSTNCKTFLNMRILHISDFHLSNDKSKIDKSQMVVNGLLKTVETANQENQLTWLYFLVMQLIKEVKDLIR